MVNYPLLLCIASLVCLWAAAKFGARLRKRKDATGEVDHDELGVVLGATLTLLGLLIGFTFSMAVGRYDQRKNYEEEEANAIGTEYLRLDLLPDSVRGRVQEQMREYLDLRIRDYQTYHARNTSDLDTRTALLQQEMWSQVKDAGAAAPNPVMATVVVGMNDVINRQGYTQAARWNRIPRTAWGLMFVLALLSNFLLGFNVSKLRRFLLLAVPLSVSISFFLIADIDSPRGGLIRVAPENLIVVADSLKSK